jgi:hypothetical protein
MKKVQAAGEPVVVTRQAPVEAATKDIFDCMAGKAEIVGDIETPIPVKWAARFIFGWEPRRCG